MNFVFELEFLPCVVTVETLKNYMPQTTTKLCPFLSMAKQSAYLCMELGDLFFYDTFFF